MSATLATSAADTDVRSLVPTDRDIERVYDAYCHLLLEVEETTNPLVRDALKGAAQTLSAQLTTLNALAKYAAQA